MLLSNKVPLDKRPTRAQMHWGCGSSALVHTHVGKGGCRAGLARGAEGPWYLHLDLKVLVTEVDPE